MDITNRTLRSAGPGTYAVGAAALGMPVLFYNFDPNDSLPMLACAAIAAPCLVVPWRSGLPDAPRHPARRRWPGMFALLVSAAAVIVSAGNLVMHQAAASSNLWWTGGLIMALGVVILAAGLVWREAALSGDMLLFEASRHAIVEHQVEEALHTLKIEYRDFFMSHPTPMWIHDPATMRILAVNDAACAQYGYSRDELLAMTAMQLRPESERASLQAYLAEPQGRGESAGVWRHRRKDGSALDVEIITHELQWRGRPVRIVNAADVTRRVAAERELQDLNAHLAAKVQERTLKVRRYAKRLRSRKHELEMANRDLEMFSYSASHDLRTPLWVLTIFVDMLVKDAGDRLPQDIAQNIHKIQHAARHMTALVDDLMKLAKVSKQTVSRSIVDVTKIAETQVALLRSKDPERKVEVEIERGLRANVDEGLLGIALENLIGNAWKYSAYVPQARIRVGVEHRDGEMAFFVADNGAGFDMEDARDLFKPFHRMHSDELFEGTGIGLAIVQRVVGLHGGSIWAEAAPDKGATFYFRLGLTARVDAPRESRYAVAREWRPLGGGGARRPASPSER